MTVTVNSMQNKIGKLVAVKVTSHWTIPMTVLDARFLWGKVQLLVTPMHGEGEAWIDTDRVSF